MEKMYPPVVNSPKTELTELITDTQTEITVANAAVLLQGEGIAVLGNGDVAETITYTSVEENVLKGCIRGFEGVARAWPVGTRVARNFTAADFKAAQDNIIEIDGKVTTLSTTVSEKTQDASLTKKGVVQLSKAVNGTGDDIAATESAVKAAYDLANSSQIARGDAPKDWNNAIQNGIYRVAVADLSSYSNVPPGAYGYGVLEVVYGVTASASTAQRYQTHDGYLYYRTAFAGGNWSAWKQVFTASGGIVSGTITASSPIPLASVIPGQPSWVFHSSTTGSFFISPSWSNGKTDWNFDRGISVSRDNVIIATSSGTVPADSLVEMYRGIGSPEGAVTAPVGALYRNRVGGAGSTLYIKESGSGNTGWRAV
ncbi:pyocin knob domain-containing protein [Paenibacillus polymyxa]|uniref:pyocin knob domain-containing protein n=1 Tax=Paenibacillus polymyxa TaxID=1406 RepID=UPI003D2B1809